MPCFTLFFLFFIILLFPLPSSIGSMHCFSILQPVPFSFLCAAACVLTSAARVRLRIEGAEYSATQTLAIPYENAMGSKDFHRETLTCLSPDHSLYRILYSFIGWFRLLSGNGEVRSCCTCTCNCTLTALVQGSSRNAKFHSDPTTQNIISLRFYHFHHILFPSSSASSCGE